MEGFADYIDSEGEDTAKATPLPPAPVALAESDDDEDEGDDNGDDRAAGAAREEKADEKPALPEPAEKKRKLLDPFAAMSSVS